MQGKSVRFCIRLADVVIGVSALYESTKEFCRDYLTEGDADFNIFVSFEDINFEREKSAHEDIVEGIPVRQFTDEYLETLAVYRKIAAGLLSFSTILLHGSVVAVDGIGYLFTAKSGTGKSTHTKLWMQYFGGRAVMVNDDKPLLRITDQGVTAYGTPWDGKHHRSNNIAVPLKAVCLLERGKSNQIVSVTGKSAYPQLLWQSFRPSETERLRKTLQLVDDLCKRVKLYRLKCNMEPEAVRCAYEGIQK